MNLQFKKSLYTKEWFNDHSTPFLHFYTTDSLIDKMDEVVDFDTIYVCKNVTKNDFINNVIKNEKMLKNSLQFLQDINNWKEKQVKTEFDIYVINQSNPLKENESEICMTLQYLIQPEFKIYALRTYVNKWSEWLIFRPEGFDELYDEDYVYGKLTTEEEIKNKIYETVKQFKQQYPDKHFNFDNINPNKYNGLDEKKKLYTTKDDTTGISVLTSIVKKNNTEIKLPKSKEFYFYTQDLNGVVPKENEADIKIIVDNDNHKIKIKLKNGILNNSHPHVHRVKIQNGVVPYLLEYTHTIPLEINEERNKYKLLNTPDDMTPKTYEERRFVKDDQDNLYFSNEFAITQKNTNYKIKNYNGVGVLSLYRKDSNIRTETQNNISNIIIPDIKIVKNKNYFENQQKYIFDMWSMSLYQNPSRLYDVQKRFAYEMGWYFNRYDPSVSASTYPKASTFVIEELYYFKLLSSAVRDKIYSKPTSFINMKGQGLWSLHNFVYYNDLNSSSNDLIITQYMYPLYNNFGHVSPMVELGNNTFPQLEFINNLY